MCGILAIIGSEDLETELRDKLKSFVNKRGPDYNAAIQKCDPNRGVKLGLSSSVLHLRGDKLQKQPVIDGVGNILLFNGQIYKFDGNLLESRQSDTLFLSLKLKECETRDKVIEVFSAIDGPFAFVYWHEKLATIFYGRDLFGRKSLCELITSNQIPLVISSLGFRAGESTASSKTHTWVEVDCSGIHSLEFSLTRPSLIKRVEYLWKIDHVFPRTDRCKIVPMVATSEIHNDILPNPLGPLNCDHKFPIEFNAEEISNAIKGLEEKLLQAISKRIVYNQSTCLRCRKTSPSICDHSKIAVAFSGGLDSTLLALFIDKVLDDGETIDLITVAFKGDSPDRKSVGIAFQELRRLCPRRIWRLVIADISKMMLEHERQEVIRHLISPCDTVVDDSIGCACWFISRGCGRSLDSSIGDADFEDIFEAFLEYDVAPNANFSISHDKIQQMYTCPAAIIFAGMGIDEQLGGYSSHRAAWSKSGCGGLLDEISFQMRRISYRNLGRDDRTFSDHGRDLRLPYLDFDLVSYLNQLPVGLKMNLDDTLHTGPKKLLRELALHCGLPQTSVQVKRALQFGTRIAKLDNAFERGSDICKRLI